MGSFPFWKPMSPGDPLGNLENGGKMSDGQQDQLLGFVAGLLLGAAIGATAAFLTAPQSGQRTRKKLGRTASGLKQTTGDRWDELAEDVKARVDEAVSGARKHLGQG